MRATRFPHLEGREAAQDCLGWQGKEKPVENCGRFCGRGRRDPFKLLKASSQGIVYVCVALPFWRTHLSSPRQDDSELQPNNQGDQYEIG